MDYVLEYSSKYFINYLILHIMVLRYVTRNMNTEVKQLCIFLEKYTQCS